LLTSTTCLALLACSRAPQTVQQQGKAAPSLTHAAIGAWGVDLASMDRSIKPGDDFYKYVNGHWLSNNQIPPDRTLWGTFVQLAAKTEDQVHDILEALSPQAPAGSAEQKARDFYRAFLDTAAIEQAGLAPARAGLDEIAAATTHADIARLMGRAELSLDGPITGYVTVDEKNPNRYIVLVGQSGLSLPDRDYYLKQDPALEKIRSAYLAHLQRMFELGGSKDAARQAKTTLALETRIARAHLPVEQRRERELMYNPLTLEQLRALAKRYPWTEQLQAAGLQDQREFIVAELEAVKRLANEFTQIPVADWRDYLTYRHLLVNARVLPKAFDDETFAFYGRTLNGLQQPVQRWRRAVAVLDGSLGEVVGQIYVKQYFPPDSKVKMLQLVENLRAAYKKRIEGLTWMSADTKQVALQKLAKIRLKIGYPDKWRDYSQLQVVAGDAFGDVLRARKFNWNRNLQRLGRPTDRDEWAASPQTVDAYYNASYNEIVFPAGILQPPFFDPNADPAVNYGGIGGVIGHEMGHGFDDQGAKSDADGVLRTWWQPADEQKFKGLVDGLVAQYSGYEPLPGMKLNGRFTAGENIGDLGGLSVAYEAYQLSLNGRSAPVLDNFTGDQRFFLSQAQVWRMLVREEQMRNLVMTDEHSPPLFRVHGVVRNMDAWYAAFRVQPGDALYLEPERRIRIW
jgi:predicted metalloendopeptidase